VSIFWNSSNTPDDASRDGGVIEQAGNETSHDGKGQIVRAKLGLPEAQSAATWSISPKVRQSPVCAQIDRCLVVLDDGFDSIVVCLEAD
jgi:hypothetical protein